MNCLPKLPEHRERGFERQASLGSEVHNIRLDSIAILECLAGASVKERRVAEGYYHWLLRPAVKLCIIPFTRGVFWVPEFLFSLLDYILGIRIWLGVISLFLSTVYTSFDGTSV